MSVIVCLSVQPFVKSGDGMETPCIDEWGSVRSARHARDVCVRWDRRRSHTIPSNVNVEISVPDTAATVTTTFVGKLVSDVGRRHCTVVPLAHDDVAQSTDATVAVGVRSLEAKAMPLSVAVRPPETGALLPMAS